MTMTNTTSSSHSNIRRKRWLLNPYGCCCAEKNHQPQQRVQQQQRSMGLLTSLLLFLMAVVVVVVDILPSSTILVVDAYLTTTTITTTTGSVVGIIGIPQWGRQKRQEGSRISSTPPRAEANVGILRRRTMMMMTTELKSTTTTADAAAVNTVVEEEEPTQQQHLPSSMEGDGVGSSTSATSTTTTTIENEYKAPPHEIAKRRNLAIISHPDSGKTTMTEKLLLYGGAVQEAGAVRSKASQRSTTSDFMSIEQERGISISSTVMNFEYNEYSIRLLDTPGHNDFSEDTYRALAAADNALMLLDCAKGLEPQTRKLFTVCRLRQLPLFTFVNKMDRPALSPYTIMDQIEAEFQLPTHPIFWPIGDGDRFCGVLDRTTSMVILYQKSEKRGQKATTKSIPLSDTSALYQHIPDKELVDKLLEDAELLDELIAPLNIDDVMAGHVSPLFFGSAMTNFGVEQFLIQFCKMGTQPLGRTLSSSAATTSPPPTGDDTTDRTTTTSSSSQQQLQHSTTSAEMIHPEYDEFTGFIFKTQANLDPKHRDRLAYVRIVSGVYRKGMKVGHSRSPRNKRYSLAQAQALFGSDRTAVEIAYPGDVIGINNPGNFAIGDTLYTGPTRITFPGIPSFSPEKFAYIRAPNPSDYKAFRKGMDQLLDEGAVQALRQRNDDGGGPLMLAAVGQLQFEVVQARLKQEYNVDSIMEPLGYSIARWADGGWDAVDRADAAGKLFGSMIVQDRWHRPVLLFRNDWKAASVTEEEAYLQLQPWSQPPVIDT